MHERLYTDLVGGLLLLLLALLTIGAGAQPAAQDTARPAFTEWLDEVRTEALARGIRPEILEQALAGVEEPLGIVLERDRAQTEIVLPLETYIGRRLTRTTIRAGRQMLARHQTLLREVEAQYGVPGRVITAIWGIESNFGRFSGVRPTISALATLAWDPRRSTLFRRELFSALEILNRGDIEPGRLQGSWAGAMGQPQFMPSSYLAFAEDFDRDGRRDIWTSPPDVFASIANYLKGHGWTPAERWGREVMLTRDAVRRAAADVARRGDGCRARRDMTVTLPLEDWQKIGVRLPGGASLPDADRTASLVSGTTRHFLVYRNYEALLDYNCAHAYALTVALLADALSAGG
jgi:membrane-bound lytic murein transglycosylase B